MTLQTLGGVISWPNALVVDGGSIPSTSNSTTLDASGEYHSLVICASESMAITHVGFNVATATGSPTADVRIETVGTDGLPTGNLWATTTNIVTGALSTNWTLHALTSTANITAGQLFCVKVLYNSGTTIVLRQSQQNPRNALPYTVINTGTPTKAVQTVIWHAALGSSTTTFYNVSGMLPILSVANNSFNNTSAARRALRFQVPFKCRCVGLHWHNNTAVGDFNYMLLDESGAELSSSSTAIEGDCSGAAATGALQLMFDSPVTLSPATWYRAAMEPSSVTNCNIQTIVLPSADYRSATPWGLNSHYATYVTASWTDTATNTLPMVGILIDQLDDGVNTGGSARTYGIQPIPYGV